jgi:hypothetical protein
MDQKGNYDRQKAMNRAAIGGYTLGPLGAIIGGSFRRIGIKRPASGP